MRKTLMMMLLLMDQHAKIRVMLDGDKLYGGMAGDFPFRLNSFLEDEIEDIGAGYEYHGDIGDFGDPVVILNLRNQ